MAPELGDESVRELFVKSYRLIYDVQREHCGTKSPPADDRPIANEEAVLMYSASGDADL